MRKLVVTNMMSLDGYFTGPDDNVMALPFDHMFDAYNAERMREADTLVMGRASYEGFQSYWPPIADSPDAGPAEREVSQFFNTLEKVVVSDSLADPQTGVWGDTTRVVRRADADKVIRDLKNGPGRDIAIFASHVLWNSLLAAGLVDELHLIVGAGTVGAGTPIFETKPMAGFQLQGVRTFEGSNNPILQYTGLSS